MSSSETEPQVALSGDSPARRRGSRALIGFASLTLLLSLVYGWATDTLFDSQEFADRSVAALTEDDVAQLVAEQLTAQIVESGPEELLSVQPVVEGVTLAVLQSSGFQNLAAAAVADLHQAFFSEGRDSVVLDLADVVTASILRLDETNPEISTQIPDDLRAGALRISSRSFATETVQLAEQTKALAFVFPVLTVVLWLAAIGVAKDRRDAVSMIGFSAVAVALLVMLLLVFVNRLITGWAETDDARTVIDVVWDSFTQPLWSTAIAVGLLGAVVAALAVALVRPITFDEQLRAFSDWVRRRPASTLGQAILAVLTIGLGVFVLVRWELVVQLVIWLIGFNLLFIGLNEIIRLAGIGEVPGPTPEEVRESQREQSRMRTRRLIRGGVLVGVVLGVGLLGFAIWRAATTGPSPAVEIAGGCNGSEELCDRPLDRVAFASTHNSMAASGYRNWLFAEHVETIDQQLDDGIRGLLIDTWYGVPNESGAVSTDFRGGVSREELVDLYGEEAIGAAERVSENIGEDLNATEIYLCHNLCEFGAVPLTETLTDVRRFLDESPGEVIVIFIQDQTDAADVALAFEAAGLADLVWDEFDKTGMAEDVSAVQFPTLGEMVEKNKRVLVMAENDSGEVPWYYDGFTLTQDTPFTFRTVEDLEDPASCDENRGSPESPLFLLNHWITTSPPSPSLSTEANSFDVLFDRAIRCGQARNLVPNLVAVNFYERGDLFEVVDTLNGVEEDPGDES